MYRIGNYVFSFRNPWDSSSDEEEIPQTPYEEWNENKIKYCFEMRLTEFHATYMLACADRDGVFKKETNRDPLSWTAYGWADEGHEVNEFKKEEVPTLIQGLMKRLEELTDDGYLNHDELAPYAKMLGPETDDNWDAVFLARIHTHKKMMELDEDFAAEDIYFDFDIGKKEEEGEADPKKRLEKAKSMWEEQFYGVRWHKC